MKDKQEVKQAAPIREKRGKKRKLQLYPLPKGEENAAPREEKREEKTEETSGGGLMWAAAAVFVIGAAIGVYFLWNPPLVKDWLLIRRMKFGIIPHCGG